PPVVDAGSDRNVNCESLPCWVELDGMAEDPDGDPLDVQWTQVTGGFGGFELEDPLDPLTPAIFYAVGAYQLRLTASDGEYAVSDDVVIVISNEEPPAEGPSPDVTGDGWVDYRDLRIVFAQFARGIVGDNFPDWVGGKSLLGYGIGTRGSATYAENEDIWTVSGGGADIWGNSDEFYFLQRALSGDGQITARILSTNGFDTWHKAGVMFRANGDDPRSPHATMLVSPDHGVALQYREYLGGSSKSVHTDTPVELPVALRLNRTGDLFTGYVLREDGTWDQWGSATVQMGQDVHTGLAVTSHDPGGMATARFDRLSLHGDGGGENTIGTTPTGGSSYNAGQDVLTVVGKGRDIWGVQDEFHYVHERLSGDGQITVNVRSMEDVTDTWDHPTLLLHQRPDVDSGHAGGDPWAMKGDSKDIWGDAAGLHDTYEPLPGDGPITAAVAGPGSVNNWAKAGVMIRETLDANSKHAFTGVSPGYGAFLQSRPVTGGSSESQDGGKAASLKPPVCLRIVREGDEFTAFYFSDGEWVQLGTAFIPMKPDVYIGTAVTSHDEAQLVKAIVDDNCPVSVADIHDYGQVNFMDFSFLANWWLEEWPSTPGEP
ncbi:MAG: hypothetical protein JSU70_08830, partial [Phycisphaerales bacterium]